MKSFLAYHIFVITMGMTTTPIMASKSIIIQHIFYITSGVPSSMTYGSTSPIPIFVRHLEYNLRPALLYFRYCPIARQSMRRAGPAIASFRGTHAYSISSIWHTFYSSTMSLYLLIISDTAFSNSTEGLSRSLALSIYCPFSGFAIIS